MDESGKFRNRWDWGGGLVGQQNDVVCGSGREKLVGVGAACQPYFIGIIITFIIRSLLFMKNDPPPLLGYPSTGSHQILVPILYIFMVHLHQLHTNLGSQCRWYTFSLNGSFFTKIFFLPILLKLDQIMVISHILDEFSKKKKKIQKYQCLH